MFTEIVFKLKMLLDLVGIITLLFNKYQMGLIVMSFYGYATLHCTQMIIYPTDRNKISMPVIFINQAEMRYTENFLNNYLG